MITSQTGLFCYGFGGLSLKCLYQLLWGCGGSVHHGGKKVAHLKAAGSKERLEEAELPLPLLGHFPVPFLGAFLFSYKIVCFIMTFSYMHTMNFNSAHSVSCTVYALSYFPFRFCSVSNNILHLLIYCCLS